MKKLLAAFTTMAVGIGFLGLSAPSHAAVIGSKTRTEAKAGAQSTDQKATSSSKKRRSKRHTRTTAKERRASKKEARKSLRKSTDTPTGEPGQQGQMGQQMQQPVMR